jgi:hypothetical protein
MKNTFDFTGPEGNVFNMLALMDNYNVTPSEAQLRQMQYAGICLHFIRNFRDMYDFVNIPTSVFEEADKDGDSVTH